MKKKQKLILAFVGLLIVVVCCIMYSHLQQKNNEYSYELLRVKSSLEQTAQYSENCIESISSSKSEEDHGDLMKAVTELDLSTSRIALLHNGDGSIGRHIFELSDHLNGTYPYLSDDTKLYWLECIRDASEAFLSTLEQSKNMSFGDFSLAVQNFSSRLPTYE